MMHVRCDDTLPGVRVGHPCLPLQYDNNVYNDTVSICVYAVALWPFRRCVYAQLFLRHGKRKETPNDTV